MAGISVIVEGRDDLFALVELLKRHGLDYDNRRDHLPTFGFTEGIDPLLDGMTQRVRLSGGQPVAFVLDADTPLASRWQAVRDRLGDTDVTTPKTPPPAGFIGVSSEYGTRVGVWIDPRQC